MTSTQFAANPVLGTGSKQGQAPKVPSNSLWQPSPAHQGDRVLVNHCAGRAGLSRNYGSSALNRSIAANSPRATSCDIKCTATVIPVAANLLATAPKRT